MIFYISSTIIGKKEKKIWLTSTHYSYYTYVIDIIEKILHLKNKSILSFLLLNLF